MKKIFPLTMMEVVSFFGLAMGAFAIIDKTELDFYLKTITAMALFFVISITVAVHRIWSTRENEFRIYEDIEGNGSKKDIINAKESILFTHFTEDSPSDAYVELLLDKIRENVHITRILPKNIDFTDPKNNWLMKFNEFRGKGYTEYFLDANIMPIDIAIYDEKTVKILLPRNKDSSLFNQCVSLTDEKVARMMRASIERLNTTPNNGNREGQTSAVLEPS